MVSNKSPNPNTASETVRPDTSAAAPLVATPANEQEPAISPDGNLLAYTSDEEGRKEIYLLPLPSGNRIKVSTQGGEIPVWSSEGDELYYLEGETLMAVQVERHGRLSVTAPTPLFSGADVSSPMIKFWFPMYGIAPRGDFLVVQRSMVGKPSLVALQNWARLLESR